ncbi:hypothetical protein GCM10022222_18220 [Amycolatopsis ultiminotia]|uniref:GntR C-terminal domain-containing protein n=1 Tax=Amycolatopsis ultiminotia TaxID=543629 RepID=A0ABP6VFP6_9PSEU
MGSPHLAGDDDRRATQARFAATRVDDATLDRLSAIVDEIANPTQEDPAAQQRLAHRFDEVLAETTGNAVLDGLIASVSVFGAQRRARQRRRAHALRERRP